MVWCKKRNSVLNLNFSRQDDGNKRKPLKSPPAYEPTRTTKVQQHRFPYEIITFILLKKLDVLAAARK